MEDAKDDYLVVIRVEFVNNDERQSSYRPFECAWDDTDVTEFREFAEPIGFSKNTRDDARSGSGAAAVDIQTNSVNLGERFKREAHLHKFIREILS